MYLGLTYGNKNQELEFASPAGLVIEYQFEQVDLASADGYDVFPGKVQSDADGSRQRPRYRWSLGRTRP